MNTRTILLWHNNGEDQISFTVNPEKLTVTRPNCNRTARLAMGGTVNLWGGRGLREVKFTTFLPGEKSTFFSGRTPAEILSLLRDWQDSGDPVRLILSGSDINDAFLIEDISETLREGDEDVELTLSLREYKFKSALSALVNSTVKGGASAPIQREDERILPDTWTVKRGDTLWDIACELYGDGTKWRQIAEKNGISNPRMLQIGRVLVL